jgi:hypothetical protein
MTEHLLLLAEAVDKIAALTADDESVKYRWGAALRGWKQRRAHRRCSAASRSRKPCAISPI